MHPRSILLAASSLCLAAACGGDLEGTVADLTPPPPQQTLTPAPSPHWEMAPPGADCSKFAGAQVKEQAPTPDGGVVLVGRYLGRADLGLGPLPAGDGVFAQAFDRGGRPSWSASWPKAWSASVSVAPAGDVVVVAVGSEYVGVTRNTARVARLSPAGQPRWERSFSWELPAMGRTLAQAAAAAGDDATWVAMRDTLVKLDADGAETLRLPLSFEEVRQAVPDGAGGLYIVGVAETRWGPYSEVFAIEHRSAMGGAAWRKVLGGQDTRQPRLSLSPGGDALALAGALVGSVDVGGQAPLSPIANADYGFFVYVLDTEAHVRTGFALPPGLIASDVAFLHTGVLVAGPGLEDEGAGVTLTVFDDKGQPRARTTVGALSESEVRLAARGGVVFVAGATETNMIADGNICWLPRPFAFRANELGKVDSTPAFRP